MQCSWASKQFDPRMPRSSFFRFLASRVKDAAMARNWLLVASSPVSPQAGEGAAGMPINARVYNPALDPISKLRCVWLRSSWARPTYPLDMIFSWRQPQATGFSRAGLDRTSSKEATRDVRMPQIVCWGQELCEPCLAMSCKC
ncbi:unnamed protein product [Effrenium voratum]|nr:unnamed protein product [Effrenium voratum]